MPGLHAHDARGFLRPVAAGKRRAKGERHLAENAARQAPAEPAFHAVDRLVNLDLAREYAEQRPFAAFGHGDFAGREMDVGRGLRDAREFCVAKR